MSKEKKNKASSANGKKHAGWLKRAFFGGSRTLADEMLETDRFGQRQVSDVEMILSPGKQILKNFLEKSMRSSLLWSLYLCLFSPSSGRSLCLNTSIPT